MEEKQFEKLMEKLDGLTRLVAYNIVSDKKLKDQVTTLYSLGYTPTQIASFLSTTKDNISQYIYRKKK